MKELRYKNNKLEIKQVDDSYEHIVSVKLYKLTSHLKSLKLTNPQISDELDIAISRLEKMADEDVVSCHFDNIFSFSVAIDKPNKMFYIQKDFIPDKCISIRYYIDSNKELYDYYDCSDKELQNERRYQNA